MIVKLRAQGQKYDPWNFAQTRGSCPGGGGKRAWWAGKVSDGRDECHVGGESFWWVGRVPGGREWCLVGGKVSWWAGRVLNELGDYLVGEKRV